MKEIIFYHKLLSRHIKYSVEKLPDGTFSVTAVVGFLRHDPPAYPGASVPDPVFVPERAPKGLVMDRDFMIALARFYLRVTRDENPTRYPWQEKL